MNITTKRPLARILISFALALAFSGAAPMAALAETGVDPAAIAPFLDDGSDAEYSVDFAPGFKDYEIDAEFDSLKRVMSSRLMRPAFKIRLPRRARQNGLRWFCPSRWSTPGRMAE